MENDTLTSSSLRGCETGRDIAEKIARSQGQYLVQYCGGGGYGQVWLIDDGHNWRRALKIVNVATCKSDVEREQRGVIECCTRVNRDGSLLTIHHYGSTDGYFWYFMQLADDARNSDGSYLADSLEVRLRRNGTFGLKDIHTIIGQVLDGVKVLHSNGLVHRDIKPANILFVGGRAVLGDIGLVVDDTEVTLAGTEQFVPREIVTHQTNSIDGHMQDLYAVGCLIRIMLGVDLNVTAGRNFQVPTDRVSRRLNALTLRACSSDTAQRYRDVTLFRRDFEACFSGMSCGAGRLLALSLGAMALILVVIGLVVSGLREDEESGAGGASLSPSVDSAVSSPDSSDIAVGESVNWYTLLSRTRTLRDYAFGSVMPEGLKVSFTPSGSGIGFFDQGNLRCRRRSGVLGQSGITLSFAGPLPRSFELIWLCGGDFGGMTETATLTSGKRSALLTAHVRGGSFGTGPLPASGGPLSKLGFMSVHRLICIDGRLRLLVDGLPMGLKETGIDTAEWDTLTLHYDVHTSGEIYFSSLRLNEFLE